MFSDRKKKSPPEIVTLDNIDDVAELLGMEFAQRAIEPLSKALDFIESLRASFLIPAVPYVSLRETTLYQILESFERNMKPKAYSEALSQAGFSIGMSFAEDLISFLVENNKCPKDENILIKIWMMFDTNAGWGTFDGFLDTKKKIFTIKVSDYFLARGLTEHKEKHLPFIEGYLQGVLWEILKIYPRMFEKALGIERPHYEPIGFESKKSENNTFKFVIEIRDEELTPAFDNLYKAFAAFRDSDYDKCLLHARRALEFAFKLKSGLEVEIKKDLPSIMRDFRDSRIEFSYGKAKDVYGIASSGIHAPRKLIDKRYRELLDNTRTVLRELEISDVPQKLSKKLRERILVKNMSLSDKGV